MDREYEFLVTTDEPHRAKGMDRGRIRKLVMRNFLVDKEKEGVVGRGAESSSMETVRGKMGLRSRFRVAQAESKSSGIERAPARRAEKISDKDGGEREKRIKESRKITGLSVHLSASPKSKTSSRSVEVTEEGSDGKGLSTAQSVIKINPSNTRFDPFDVLPIPGSPELDTLFRLYKKGSRINLLAINARNTWWPFISRDAGLLHATLATWALYGMLTQDSVSWRVAKLKHKNEAIREVNAKIGIPGRGMSDEVVGTVLTLASFENLVGDYDAAQLHIVALKRMINARGGLFAFGHNDGLIRGMIWVDFHTATAFHTAPTFPQIKLDPDTPPLPNALLEHAAYTSPTSLLQLSVAGVDCFNIFYRLHRLALAVSSEWIRKVDRLTISNLLYEVEFITLSIPDRSRDFLDFDSEPKNNQMAEGYVDRARAADAASVVEALIAAIHIFVYASLRDLPPRAKIFSVLMDRVRIAMDRPVKKSVLEVWKMEKNLNVLVWVLTVVASSVAQTWGDRAWWVALLAEAVDELKIQSQEDLLEALKRVAWTDNFFSAEVLGDIWGEVETGWSATPRNGFDVRLGESGEEGQERAKALIEYDKGRWKVNGWYV